MPSSFVKSLGQLFSSEIVRAGSEDAQNMYRLLASGHCCGLRRACACGTCVGGSCLRVAARARVRARDDMRERACARQRACVCVRVTT
eukprot:4109560-Pleurochrysis_carterae.AAC.1